MRLAQVDAGLNIETTKFIMTINIIEAELALKRMYDFPSYDYNPGQVEAHDCTSCGIPLL